MAGFVRDMLFEMLIKRQDETDPDEAPEAGEKEQFTSWALFILIMLLIAALITSYLLQQKRIQAVHETVISIFAGMIVGLIVRATPGTSFIQSQLAFDYQFFFNLLLPPIILASGYELNQANFFRNIGTILTFAFAGTFISALVLGLILFVWTRIPLDGLDISFVEAISVGATLSATDPVTILAIFNLYKVEPKLYTVIFGESILNDAIAIVVFETAQRYKPGSAEGSLTLISLFEAIGIFLVVFFSSLMIGVVIGVLTALALKYTHVRRQPKIESCLIVLVAYASYFFSNGVHMSGIVSLLFCGITLKHYAYYNMSRRTQLTTKFIFQVLAQLSENFIFIYLGLDLFAETNLQFEPLFILVTVVGICVARWIAVFPLSRAINWFIRCRARRRGKDVADELPFAYQGMLFWAGLRGAVGVALAAGLEGKNAPALRATVLVVVVLTVIIFGGTTARMLEILDIRTGVVEEMDSDDEFDIEPMHSGAYYKRSNGTGIGYTAPQSLSRRAASGPGVMPGDVVPLDTVGSANSSGNNNGQRRRLLPPRRNSRRSKKQDNGYEYEYNDYDEDDPLTSRTPTPGSGSGNRRNSAPTPASSNDFESDLAPFEDDDLPPAARRPPVTLAPGQSMTGAGGGGAEPGGSSSSGGAENPNMAIFSRQAIGEAASAVRGLFAGEQDGKDRAAWFRQLDEDYIKPKLLLDQNDHRGPGAV